jgi:hypothetical protein
MEPFKPKNFSSVNPGRSFPPFSELPPAEAVRVRETLSIAMRLPTTTSGLGLLEDLKEIANFVDSVRASDEGFVLKDLLGDLGLESTEVLVNWDILEHIDRFRLDDLSNHFDDIWYPSSDDIELIDPLFRWVVMIDHEGFISWLRFDSQS